jgi:hypothetical protein
MTAVDYLEWIEGFLKTLRTSDQIFSMLYVVGRAGNNNIFIDPDGSNIKDATLSNISRDLAYINTDSNNKSLELTSNCVLGFSNSFVTTLDNKVPGCLVEIRIGKFAKNSVNTVILQISDTLGKEEFLKRLFASLISYCQPVHANCGRVAVDTLLAQPVGDIYVGWLTYLTGIAAVDLLPKDIDTSRFLDGVIIQTSDLPAFVDEEEKIEKMLSVISALQPHGLLKNPRRRTS